MLYPVSVVDGMVHHLGGWPLRMEIAQLPTIDRDENIKCRLGEAVVTSSCSKLFIPSSGLSKEYSYVVHTAPPFYNHCPSDDPCKILRLCYRNSLTKAFAITNTTRVAVPLLGAGARGFPLDIAVEIAISETLSWCTEQREESNKNTAAKRVVFGIPDKETARFIVSKLIQIHSVN